MLFCKQKALAEKSSKNQARALYFVSYKQLDYVLNAKQVNLNVIYSSILMIQTKYQL